MELKDKIIQTAYELFSSKGFMKTTISDIVKASGASKGGFYHHFSSKEDIVNHIMDLYLQDVLAFFDDLYTKHDDDLLKVFVGVFEAINDYKRDQFKKWPEMIKMLSFPGNDLIVHKMAMSFEKSTVDFYTSVLSKGNGTFWHVDHPSYVASLWARELLLLYGEVSKVLYSWSEEAVENVRSKIKFDENLINSLLGIEAIQFEDIVMTYMFDAKKAMDEMNIQL